MFCLLRPAASYLVVLQTMAMVLCWALDPAWAEAVAASRHVEAQLQNVFRTVSPAIVRIYSDKSGEECLGIGTVISADGYVVTRESRRLTQLARNESEVHFLFANGNQVKGSVLGWSTAWGIAFAKLEEDDKWPFVEINRNTPVKAGQLCVAVDHSRLNNREYDSEPSLQLGSVSTTATPNWFAHSCKLENNSPVFSLDARLIGVTTSRPLGDDSACTSAEVLSKILDPSIDGKNLDVVVLQAGDIEPKKQELTENSAAVVDDQSLPSAITRVANATVRIRASKGDSAWSGVIVDNAGHVATCAHHRRPPGERVTIELPDGRNLRGEILGSNRIWDVGLAKITEQAEFPHVEMGNSAVMTPGTPCWLIAYPKRRKDREPLIRRMSVANRNELPWSATLYTTKGIETFGGDSGGGIFDGKGRLVAIHEGTNSGDYGRQRRIELIQRQWEYLAAGESLDSSPLSLYDRLSSEFIDQRSPPYVVTILRDGQPCALGTIVASDGQILTKRSEWYGAMSVQFADGDILPATIHKSSRKHDLALLRVLKNGLPIAPMSETQTPPVGTLLAAVIPDEPLRIGTLSHDARSIPRDRGNGLASVKETSSGVEVDEAWQNDFKLPLEPGDIIRNIAGHPTPDLQTYLDLVGDGNVPGKLVTNAGDPIEVAVQREGLLQVLRFPQPPGEWSLRNESRRHAGFPCVIDTDITLAPDLCGGPIINTRGQVLGVSIAVRRDWGGQTHVIPSDILKRFVTD